MGLPAGKEADIKREAAFEIRMDDSMDDRAEFTSDKLTPDTVYTREDLRSRFGITDATLNTGVFRPKGTSSVWLFITEEKTSDRTQYRDHLDGDTLHWQGQTSGRTDSLIIDHQARGLELLVFFRKRKYEYPGAGFRYVGSFVYTSHSGSGPTSFTLVHQKQARPIISAEEADDETFDPSSVQDAKGYYAR
jgi:putative restriction endonuclease